MTAAGSAHADRGRPASSRPGGRRPARTPASTRRPWSGRRTGSRACAGPWPSRWTPARSAARRRTSVGRGRVAGSGANDQSSADRARPAARARPGRWRSPPRPWPGCGRCRCRPAAARTSASSNRATRSGSKPANAAAERRPLAQDRQPGQPGLERLQAELLEQPHVVVLRHAPLVVVVGQVDLGRAGPAAARPAVRADDDVVHAGTLAARLRHPPDAQPGAPPRPRTGAATAAGRTR